MVSARNDKSLADPEIILASPAFAKTPTLHTCVTQWNTARLGNGHLQIKGVAANGRRALMVGFSDGACGIFFPRRQADIGGVGEFAVALRGAYMFGAAPFGGGSATAYDHISDFQRTSIKRKNILVSLRTGHVAAIRGKRILRSTLNAVDTADDCALVVTREGDAFDVTRSIAGCAITRVILNAWTDQQGRPSDGGRRILDWHCQRSSDRVVSCADGASSIAARRRQPHIVGPGGTTRQR